MWNVIIGVSYLKHRFWLKNKTPIHLDVKNPGIEEIIEVAAGYADVHSEHNRGCNNRKGFLGGTHLRNKITSLSAVQPLPAVAGSKGRYVLLRNLRIFCLSFARGLQLWVFWRHRPTRVAEAWYLAGAKCVPWLCSLRQWRDAAGFKF